MTSDAKKADHGDAVEIAPGLRRIIAPNPSPMTHWGTNSYIVGEGHGLCVIDPGPMSEPHLAALLSAIGPYEVSHILVTHSHRDHAPLAARLAARTGAPVYAFGPSTAGRSAVMTSLAQGGLTGGGEGVDAGFAPDHCLAHGATLTGPGWQITAHHTPGHMGNHMCFELGDRVFTGDHVMGWASSLVSPPDGDLTDFMASCRQLQRICATSFLPGHGAPIDDPAGRLAWLISHRETREAQILSCLAHGPGGQTPAEIARAVYKDTPAELLPAAERNVFAHLADLTTRGKATPLGRLSHTAKYRLR